jgi:hypothetical protein
LTISTATDLGKLSLPRRIARSPAAFDDSLEVLLEKFIEPILPSPSIVATYHWLLSEYCDSEDPLFLIRYMRGTERGMIYSTATGARFKATDNAPAWWMHFALFHEISISAKDFPQVVATIPAHMFEVSRQLPENINTAGWHVAHIADVKDRNVNFSAWTAKELRYRFLRMVHPCNYFFLPTPDWQKWGRDERVINFFASVYAERYRAVWGDFVAMSGIDPSRFAGVRGAIRYHYSTAHSQRSSSAIGSSSRIRVARAASEPPTSDVRLVSYSSSRLLFKADVIDALRDNDRFRVVTPAGTYEMSKADFLRVFQRATLTLSWRRDRWYHYPKPPAAAAEFLLPDSNDDED